MAAELPSTFPATPLIHLPPGVNKKGPFGISKEHVSSKNTLTAAELSMKVLSSSVTAQRLEIEA